MSPSQELSGAIREWTKTFMHSSGHEFRHFMDESGLSFSQISVLLRLYHEGKSGISGIGSQLGVTIAAASQSVDRLVQMDLVERKEDPEDRRAKRLALTSKGRALVEKSIEVRSQWIENLADALTEQQQEKVKDGLTILTEAARTVHG